MNYCSEKAGLIFSFGEGRDSDLQLSRLEQVVKDCAVNNTKSAFVFLDKSTVRPLPPPSFLAMFDIVITTTQRFTNEWKSGSFQDELKRKERESDLSSFDYEIDEEQACPLLKVRWLRMIVDEGHSMGRGKTSSAILFASWIYAERRWAMTGTPTRQTVGDSGISNVSFLMRYLQHDFFSSRRDGDKVWKNLIAKGWKEGFLASFFRLRSLLAFLVVRHTKLDIEELPLPHFQETVLQMSNEEVKAYNSLVWGVQSNLVLTSMKADTSGMQDSVLDPRNFKYAFAFMSSIRVACGCGGTKLTSTIPKKFDEETMSMLRESRLPEFKLKVRVPEV
jgi:SNF2 family DNA or RNA helicase